MRNWVVQERSPTLGVDFGRVINDGSSHPSGDDTAFLTGSEGEMLATPEMAGSFEALARLTDRFDGRAWIVFKAGPRIQGQHRALAQPPRIL